MGCSDSVYFIGIPVALYPKFTVADQTICFELLNVFCGFFLIMTIVAFSY
jgi:hypothetical protein